MNKYIKEEFKKVIDGWCKTHNRTYEEALDILKEISSARKNLKY